MRVRVLLLVTRICNYCIWLLYALQKTKCGFRVMSKGEQYVSPRDETLSLQPERTSTALCIVLRSHPAMAVTASETRSRSR